MSSAAPNPWPRYHYAATLLRVIDGDTIRVSLDLGLRISRDVSLRIAGIDAPEINRGTPEERASGVRARDYLASLLGGEGASIFVRTYRDTQSFDRYIADVFTGDGMVDVSGAMLASGHATSG